MSLRPNQIPRGALALGLWTARLPLTVAEKVLARGHDTSAWPPAVLFDKIEAGVKEVVGRVTHDQTQAQAGGRSTRRQGRRRPLVVRGRRPQGEGAGGQGAREGTRAGRGGAGQEVRAASEVTGSGGYRTPG
jgi:hypothetical protein